MEITNPFAFSYNLVNNFGDSPPFGLYDIFNYLINHFTDYDKQELNEHTYCEHIDIDVRHGKDQSLPTRVDD